jgi:hypothetical protein
LPLPQFFLAGAPKAGTTALHAALAPHPELFLSPVKEPKYFLCGDRPPARSDQRGPGDAHSAREWVWRRKDYERLFAAAPPGTLPGESTPFYLWSREAQRRIVDAVPEARFVVAVRDPVDRAYSNWMHLWSDGLEPIPDFVAAVRAEEQRVAAGWAPFWHYRGLGRYGEQLQHLLTLVPRGQVHLLRYRQLVSAPQETLDDVCRFLGVSRGLVATVPPENVRPYVWSTPANRLLARGVRAGATLGAFAPPVVWRGASRPLLAALHAGGASRPPLSVADRQEVLAGHLDDIALLERLTDESFADWRRNVGRGEFRERLNRPATDDHCDREGL